MLAPYRKAVHIVLVTSLLVMQIQPLRAQGVPVRPAASQDAESDGALAARVKSALHKDPYFYDKHVDVSVDKGAVVLSGFVFSDWDLRNAVRIATQAAEGRKVIDNLSIQQGGRR